MAQTINKILLKRSDVIGHSPLVNSLTAGEIVANTADGILFLKKKTNNNEYVVKFLNSEEYPYLYNSTLSSIKTQYGNNNVLQAYDIILGGVDNTIDGAASSILNGQSNKVSSNFSVILGGYSNQIKENAYFSSIIGGSNNTILSTANYSTILGGVGNTNKHESTYILGDNISTHSDFFVYVNNLSSTGDIYTGSRFLSGGVELLSILQPTFNLVQEVYTAVKNTSADWNSVYSYVRGVSSLELQSRTFVNSNSSNILEVNSRVNNTSANWNSVYSYTNLNSAFNLSARTFVNNNSANIIEVNSRVNDTSANWNSVYSYTNLNSALELQSRTFVNNNSANIIEVNSRVNNTSANWNSVYGYTNTNSAFNLASRTFVNNNSANILEVNSRVNNTSAIWNSVYSYTNNTSGLELQVRNFVNSNSSNLVNVSSVVNNTSANWNSGYSFYNSNSGTYAKINYVDSKFLPLTGGLVTGKTTFNNNVTVYGVLSATGGTYFANTYYTTTSALSVVHVGDGPALYVGQTGSGDIASFYDMDQNVEVLHVGGANGNFPNVGIKTSNPNVDFTVNGQISASGNIWTSGRILSGGQELLSIIQPSINIGIETHTNIKTLTGNWNSVYNFTNLNSAFDLYSRTFVNNNSANILEVNSRVNTTSANWNSVYSYTNNTSGLELQVRNFVNTNSANLINVSSVVNNTSANWNSVYSHTNNNSASNLASRTFVQNNSSNILKVNTKVNTTSANWDSVYSSYLTNSSLNLVVNTFVNNNSANILEVNSRVNNTSANWNSVYSYTNNISGLEFQSRTFVNNNSSNILEVNSRVNTTSANWNSVYSYTNSNTALELQSRTFVGNNSANILQVNSRVNNTSANWNSVYSQVNLTSAFELNVRNFVNTNSANLINVSTKVNNTSANWDSVYSFVNSNSSTNSSNNTFVQNNSSNILEVNTKVNNTSANWDISYVYGTAYSTNSSSLVTNTILNSVSSLLTLSTTTSILTGQLVKNSDFENYKTNVANSTATLLPITTYQNASGVWQETYTQFISVSGSLNASLTATTLSTAVTSDVAVGGITISQIIPKNTTLQQFVETILTKIYYPSITSPSASMTSSIGTNVEAGTQGITLTVNLNRGSITGKTVSNIWDPNTLQDYRSGTATQYIILGVNNGTTSSYTSAAAIMQEGTNTLNGNVTYSTGPQPVDSKGQNYLSPLASNTMSTSTIVYGRRKAFYGVNNTASNSSQIRSLVGSLLNPSNGSSFRISIPIGTTNVVFAYPSSLQDVSSVLYVEGFNSDVKGNFSQTTVSVEAANGYTATNYKVYKYTPVSAFTQAVNYDVTI